MVVRPPSMLVLPIALLLATGCSSAPPKPSLGPPAPPGSIDPIAPDSGPTNRSPGAGPSRPSAADDSLLPTRIRVHPLTRFALDPQSNLELICHIGLLDRFGQSVKGLGLLRLELYRPGGNGGGGGDSRAGLQTQESVWTVNLGDPEENARAYDDLVTRTYVVRLAQIPPVIRAWLGISASAGQAAVPSQAHQPASPETGADAPDIDVTSPTSGGWLTLKAYFTVTDSAGRQTVLQASYRLQR
jgi:hypothetical protein